MRPQPPQDAQPQSNRSLLRPIRSILVHLEKTLVAGILVTLPIAITVLILKFFFDLLNPILEPAVAYIPGPDVPGLGLVALVILIYLVGLVTAFVVGRRLIGLAHRVLEVIPVVKGIYSTTRTAVEFLSSANGRRYSGVVLIEFPRPGAQAVGLITSRMIDNDGTEKLAVYIPTTPIPSSGFLVIVPASEVTPTVMTVEDAMRVVISGGILSGQIFEQFGLLTQDKSNSNQ